MEERRILWVSAAVGIFLLIVIGAALILYAPQKNAGSPASSAQSGSEQTWILGLHAAGSAFAERPQTDTTQASEQANAAGSAPAVLPSDAAAFSSNTEIGKVSSDTVQSRDLTVISNNTTVYTKDNVTTIDLTGASRIDEQKVIDAAPGMQAASDVKTVVPVNPQEYAGSSVQTKTSKPKNTAAVSAAKPASSSKKTQGASKPKAVSQSKNTQTKPAAKSSAVKPAAKVVDRYWVQAASFTDKANAEAARSILADEKIPAEVFTYQDKKGLTYYRLRVGPYTTESEAEYWNSRIKLIEHFASTQSYVTNSSKPSR